MCISCVCECVSMRECVCRSGSTHHFQPHTVVCRTRRINTLLQCCILYCPVLFDRHAMYLFLRLTKKKYWSETTIFFVVVKWIGWIWSGNGNDRVIFFGFVFFSVRNCDCHSIYWAKQPDQIYMHSYNLILNYYVWCADGEEAVSMAFHLWFQIFQYLFHKMNVL